MFYVSDYFVITEKDLMYSRLCRYMGDVNDTLNRWFNRLYAIEDGVLASFYRTGQKRKHYYELKMNVDYYNDVNLYDGMDAAELVKDVKFAKTNCVYCAMLMALGFKVMWIKDGCAYVRDRKGMAWEFRVISSSGERKLKRRRDLDSYDFGIATW